MDRHSLVSPKPELSIQNFKNKVIKISLRMLMIAPLIISYFLSSSLTDTDLFYFITTGKYIIHNEIPYTNPFIIREGLDIVIQNWLWCVIVAFIYEHVHFFGIFLMNTVFVLLFCLCIWYFLKLDKIQPIYCIPVIAYLIYRFIYINIRPQMATFVLIMIELITIEEYKRNGKKGLLYFIPLLTLLEINIHASYWIMHFIVMAPYFLPGFKNTGDQIPYKNIKDFIGPIVLSIISLFINPYGLDNILYLYNSLASEVFDIFSIVELTPLSIGTTPYYLILVDTILFVILIIKKKIKSTAVYMYAFMLIITYIPKMFPFYTVGLCYLYRTTVKESGINDVKILPSTYKMKHMIGLLITQLFLLSIIIMFSVKTFTSIKDLNNNPTTDSGYIIERYLEEEDPDATIASMQFERNNYYSYMGHKVILDARPELYTDRIGGYDLISEYDILSTQSADTPDEYYEIVKSNGIDYIEVREKESLFYRTDKAHYEEIIMDNLEDYCLFKVK